MAQNPFEKALVDEGLVGTPLESLARSIYMQESSGGKNTKTSNAGAVGGMQVLPGTFQEVLPGGDINNPYDNSRAGLRYIKKMYDQSGGDLNLTAAGYYGGPGGMQKAKQGVAVSDPRNPNAPTTLEYAKQVMARQDKKDVSRETLKPEKVIGELGEGYQAAYALMAMADDEPETEREIEAREAAEEQTAAQQFANMQKQLASIKPATPFAAQEPQGFADGGDVSFEKKMANFVGLGPAYENSVQAPKDLGMSGDEGTQGDAVRHMTLMREIEKKYGPVAARALGYGHEFGFGMLKGQSSRDREMDLDNNALGLQLSKQAGSDDEKFKALVRQSLENKNAVYYRDEYKKPRKRAEGSPEEGETKSSAKDTLKEVIRSTQYTPYDLVGAPVDVINLGLKGIDYVTGSKLATEKPVGGSDYLIEKANQLGIADKPTGSMTETLTRLGTGLITPGGVAKGVELAKRPVTAARKMLDDVKSPKMAPDEIDPAVAKEIMEAKTGPRPVVRDNRLLPTGERPYVGELERIVSDLPGATTVQQIKGMMAKTGRNYEIERLENALQGLGPKDKVTSADLLKRLDETSSPMGYRVQIIEPDSKAGPRFYQNADNPRPSQALGVINLLQDVPPKARLESTFYEDMFKNLNAVKSEYKKPEERIKALDALEVYFRGPDAAGTPLGQTFKEAAPEIKKAADEILEATNFNDRFKYLHIGQKIPGVPSLTEASYEIAQTKYGKPYYELANYEQQLIKPEAEALIKQKVLEAADKRYGLDLQAQFQDPSFTSLEPKARKEAMENAFTNQMRAQALNANAQYENLMQPYAALVKQKFSEKQGYKGQHTSVAQDNPIAFSRFLDVDLPGDRKGMFVAELQSDRLDDLTVKGAKSGSKEKDMKEFAELQDTAAARKSQIDELQYQVDRGEDVAKNEIKLKQAQIEQARDEQRMAKLGGRTRGRGDYAIEEAFPGMERNPQVVQQLMIKNAVVGGIQRGKDAVLFPGADSAQKQLYEKLPNNIKAVLKDLGPGFKMENLPMTSENGDIINRISITWDKEAAERLQKQGVRFAKGGLVEKKY
jgi:SLT domain-containing protein